MTVVGWLQTILCYAKGRFAVLGQPRVNVLFNSALD
jgi:hypothetical protein